MGLLDIFTGGGGGTGATDSLYAGLLTPEQLAALKQEQATKGLLAMAAAFGQAGMPSRLPVPTGAVLGQVAGAMGQADETSAIQKFFQVQKLAQETQNLKLLAAMRQQQPELVKKLMEAAAAWGAGGNPAGTAPGAPPVDPVAAAPVDPGAAAVSDPASVAAPTSGGYGVGGAVAPGRLPRVFSGLTDSGSSLLQAVLTQVAPSVLPAGYTVAVTSADRPGARVAGTGGVSQHAQQNAIDFAILDPQGRQIPNEGPDTTGLYGQVALAARAALPETVRPQLAWGGNFTTGPAGGPRDLMHLDLAGDRGRYGTLAAMAARGGPDTVIPSRAPMPGVLQAQYAPGAGAPAAPAFSAPSTPPPAASGLPYMPTLPTPQTADTQRLLAAIAALRANSIATMGHDAYAPFETMLQNSPRWIREKAMLEALGKLPAEYAGPGANPRLQGDIAGAKARAEAAAAYGKPEFNVGLQRLLGLTSQAAKDMGVLTDQGTFAPIPNYSEAMAARAGDTAEAQQQAQLRREQAMSRFNVDPNAVTTPTPSAPGTPTVPRQGPGYTEVLPTQRGTVIPPITAAAPIVGSPKDLEVQQTGKGGWAETQNTWNTNLEALRKVNQTALAVAQVMKSYQTGAFAGELSDIRAKLKAVGIDLPASIAGDPAAAQKIIKDNFSQTITSLKGFDSNPAVYQIKLAFENWANTNLQPEANLAILAKSAGTADWQEQMVHDFAEAKRYGWRNPHDFMRVWGSQPENSLQAFIDRAATKIGPLAGAAPPQGAGTGLPPGLPSGSVYKGTLEGNPVYEVPGGGLKMLKPGR